MVLSFYGRGGYLSSVADQFNVSIATVSRYIDRVTEALNQDVPTYIRFPAGDALNEKKADFYEYSRNKNPQYDRGIGNVIGIIDGTLIPIDTGHISENEHAYVCRKGYHAINIQIVCDTKMNIMDIVSKYPGSAHDSFIFSNSALFTELEENERGTLLADDGYPLQKFCLTPIRQVEVDNLLEPNSLLKQNIYNRVHQSTRTIVERSIGVLKNRFRCLKEPLHFSPRKCCRIAVACACLHNFALERRVPEPHDGIPQDLPSAESADDTIAARAYSSDPIASTYRRSVANYLVQ